MEQVPAAGKARRTRHRIPVRSELALALCFLRQVRGLELLDVARAAEISPHALSSYETGRSEPTPDELAKIVSALEYSLDDLTSLQEKIRLDRMKACPPVQEEKLNAIPALEDLGSDEHDLRDLVRRFAEAEGYRAVVEAPIQGGVGLVDLALYHGEESIACRISVASTVEEHEVGCILECLRAGFSWVVLLSRDKRMARKMGRHLGQVAPELHLGRFDVMPPEEFVVRLKLPPPAEPGVENSRYGKYRVQVRYRELDPADAEARYRALSRIIGKSILRMAGLERR